MKSHMFTLMCNAISITENIHTIKMSQINANATEPVFIQCHASLQHWVFLPCLCRHSCVLRKKKRKCRCIVWNVSVYPLCTYRSVQAGVTWCLFGFESQKERKEEKTTLTGIVILPLPNTRVSSCGTSVYILSCKPFSPSSPQDKAGNLFCVCVHMWSFISVYPDCHWSLPWGL